MPATWDEALDAVAAGLARNRGYFGSFASAKATNEDAFVQQKFVRVVMGTNNIDHCTRLCHSPSVEAMLQQLGSGATSNSTPTTKTPPALCSWAAPGRTTRSWLRACGERSIRVAHGSSW